MPVWVIDTLKPKNGLDFPVVEAVDVAVEGYASLADAVTHFATDTAITAINAALDTKADTSALTEATANLQAQIDQIVISASAESVVAPEVAAARVDAEGTTYATLKDRLDSSETYASVGIDALSNDIDDVRQIIVVSESVNQFPQVSTFTTGGYLSGGEVVESAIFGYAEDYIPIDGNVKYTMGLVPVYGTATTPWMGCPVALEFYDKNKTYISDLPTPVTNRTFISPINAKYIRFNYQANAMGTGIINERTMLVKGDTLPQSHSAYSPTKYLPDEVDSLSEDVQTVEESIVEIDDQIHYVSENLYNPALQTPETISPHYYVIGVPYSQPTYDSSWNCTALIPVEPSTTYSVCIIPNAANSNKPWVDAVNGGFCYDADGNYISGTMFADNTFTTTAATRYIRFNYKILNLSLTQLNQRCMLVKGSDVPTEYKPYYDYYVKDKIEEIEGEITSLTVSPTINYVIDQDGDGVTLIAKHSETHDIAINLKKKGGNDLFDFYSFALIANENKTISQSTDGAVIFLTTVTDWFAPFIVGAINDIDGDERSQTFTGGNHQYNNQGSGSTPTARGVFLKFLADNREVTEGADGCTKFEMIWTNLVQGYNTKKADGSGREILQENHRLIFDGQKFEAFVDLIPLEDVYMERWYGLQWTWTPWPNTRYIGANNRALYDASSVNSNSGDKISTDVVAYGTTHEMRVGIDPDYDLGDRKYYSDVAGIFTQTYGKGYYNIISTTNLSEGNMYSLHGSYEFTARKVVEVSSENE